MEFIALLSKSVFFFSVVLLFLLVCVCHSSPSSSYLLSSPSFLSPPSFALLTFSTYRNLLTPFPPILSLSSYHFLLSLLNLSFLLHHFLISLFLLYPIPPSLPRLSLNQNVALRGRGEALKRGVASVTP